MRKLVILFVLLSFIIACSVSKYKYVDIPNTPAVGFNTEGSDAKAITIADSVMKACGGRHAWDQTRYIRWTFFNRRQLIWDKTEQRVRIDFLDGSLKVRLNLKDMTGKAFQNGIEVTQPDSLKKLLEKGKSIWINDSYWLVMPFKLKDSGVTLKYVGKKNNYINAECDVLELTFKAVGDTPNNKYNIYVNPSSHMVTQWDYYGKNTDEKPAFSSPWSDYRGLGNIMLAVSRGEGRLMSPMGVYKSMPDTVFVSKFDVDWKAVK
jgi:plasmid maintenance system killer protein